MPSLLIQGYYAVRNIIDVGELVLPCIGFVMGVMTIQTPCIDAAVFLISFGYLCGLRNVIVRLLLTTQTVHYTGNLIGVAGLVCVGFPFVMTPSKTCNPTQTYAVVLYFGASMFCAGGVNLVVQALMWYYGTPTGSESEDRSDTRSSVV